METQIETTIPSSTAVDDVFLPKKKLKLKVKSTTSDNTDNTDITVNKRKCSEKTLAYQKEYYQKNKEKYQEMNRENYREKNKDREIPVLKRFGVEKVPKEKVKKEKPPKVYKIPKGNSPEEYRQNRNEYNRQYYADVDKKKRQELNEYIKTTIRPALKEKRKIISNDLQKEVIEAVKMYRKTIKNDETQN